MSKRIFFTDASEFSPEIQKCAGRLIKRINVYSPMYCISGLKEAINTLPYPTNKLIMAKFGLETGVYLEYRDDIIQASGISKTDISPINLIVRDALSLLRTEDYRLYYDGNIIEGLKCFCDIPRSTSKLVLFRHLQFLKTMLDTGEPYERFYNYDCSLKTLHEIMKETLSKIERECLVRAYGLETGIREEVYFIAQSLESIPDSAKNEVTSHYVFSEISSALDELYRAKSLYMQFPEK